MIMKSRKQTTRRATKDTGTDAYGTKIITMVVKAKDGAMVYDSMGTPIPGDHFVAVPVSANVVLALRNGDLEEMEEEPPPEPPEPEEKVPTVVSVTPATAEAGSGTIDVIVTCTETHPGYAIEFDGVMIVSGPTTETTVAGANGAKPATAKDVIIRVREFAAGAFIAGEAVLSFTEPAAGDTTRRRGKSSE